MGSSAEGEETDENAETPDRNAVGGSRSRTPEEAR
jgi:hypothetical protein